MNIRRAAKKTNDSKILELLGELYPAPATELVFDGSYQLLIAVMLSAQCTDRRVNLVTPRLFREFPGWKELAAAELETLEEIIRSINYFRTKAKNLLATAREINKGHQNEVPRTFEELTALPGVGRKTANVVLNELGIEDTLPVDTHVYRVARRLGFAAAEARDKVELELCNRFPATLWRKLHHFLILHGRRICKARKPLCGSCPLHPHCPTGKTLLPLS